ncbi:MAG: TetR/AcrR family transcriptional regulator [Clostridia bacterium]|nr:TetR/AcrR family transcriptional regulator [Clostridia bacterium]
MTERKEEIIKIATVLFSGNGYDNTSTRDLAKSAELSIAGLYYFFQSKEEILFTILNSALIKFVESVSSAINTDSNPQTNIKQIINCVVKHVIENNKEIGLLLRESTRLSPEQLGIIKNRQKDVFILIRNEILRLKYEGCVKDFNLSFLTFSLFGIINYSHYWFDQASELSTEEFVAETTELFLMVF